MYLSRRQKDNILDIMSRMIANKQQVAFANHAKDTERVSNGDLNFYINSPDKEFVIKYTDKTMRFNAKQRSFSELEALIFANKNKITGISDSYGNSSTIALSTKAGKALNDDMTDIKNKFKAWNPSIGIGIGNSTITGITDEGKYSEQHILTYEYWKDHEEKCKCSDEQKQQEQQQNLDNRYALKDHLHNGLHSEEDIKNIVEDKLSSKLWTRKELENLIADETEEPWYKKLFKGLEIVNEVVQDGYIVALQQQINALWAALAANGMADVGQQISGAGALIKGVSSKIGKVADVCDWVGQKFPKLADAMDTISGPIRTITSKLDDFQGVVDAFFDTSNGYTQISDYYEGVAHHIGQTGTIDDITTELLPNTVDVIKGGAGNIDTSWISSNIVPDIPTSIAAM